MKYTDKNFTVTADAIPIFDTDRPSQALVDLFNPENNKLKADLRA